MASNHLVMLPTTSISTAVTGVTTGAKITTLPQDTVALTMMAKFLYGSSGTTAKFWIQTSTDGSNWHDVINFAFTTTALVKVASVNNFVAQTPATATDISLADNAIANGWIGSYLRVKYTTTGTYAGVTNITITGVAKSLTSR